MRYRGGNKTQYKRNIGFWLNGEQYSLSDAHERFQPHPEGVPRIMRNCLILGRLGVGKSILLKELCYMHRDSSELFPLYIPMGNWFNKVEAEMAYPTHTPNSPYERDVVACTKILLSLALIETTYEHGEYKYVEDAVNLFPSHPGTEADFPKWKNEQLNMVRSVLENQAHLTLPGSSFPTVYSVADAIGRAVNKSGKKVLFLIDGVDKRKLELFRVVGSLLQRGEYLAVIATRPCPCAPDPSVLPQGVILGNDYDIHWLGKNPRTQKWRDLIEKVLENSPFDQQVIEIAIDNLQPLTSLSGASVRTAIRICRGIDTNLHGGMSAEEAWNESIRSLVNEEKRAAGEVMAALCREEPDKIIRTIVEKAIDTRQEKKQKLGPAVLNIRTTEQLFLDEKIQEFLRVCVRDGVFIPLSPALEPVPDRYEINPLLTIPDESVVFSAFGDETCVFDIESEKFKYWVKEKPGGGRPTKKKVFVPYWMSDPKERGILAQRLRERAFGRFEVLTGEDIPPGQWSPRIRNLIKESHVIVCDLTVPRRDVYVEWGWAIGLNKQVLLGCKTEKDRERAPQWWTAEQKICPFGSDSNLEKFMFQLIHMLDMSPDRVATWHDSPLYEPMDYKPHPTCIGLIGHGNVFSEVQNICQSVADEYGFDLEFLFSEARKDKVRRGGLLYEMIPLARRAGTLVLVFDGTHADFLPCVAGGIFTSRDDLSIGKKRRKKKLFLINPLGSDEILPGLLTSKPKVETYSLTGKFTIEIRKHVLELNKWRSAIISQAKGPRDKRINK
jgi:hypothetical protein